MSDKKRHFQMRRTVDPLVRLSDELAFARLQSANLAVRRAELSREETRAKFVRGQATAEQRAELVRRINALSDRLRETRRRIERIRMARHQEVGILLGNEFSYYEIVTYTAEFTTYVGYHG